MAVSLEKLHCVGVALRRSLDLEPREPFGALLSRIHVCHLFILSRELGVEYPRVFVEFGAPGDHEQGCQKPSPKSDAVGRYREKLGITRFNLAPLGSYRSFVLYHVGRFGFFVVA